MTKSQKIKSILFFIVNFCFIWISKLIADLIVTLARLDEFNGYMLTAQQEFNYFLFFSISMLFIQFFILRFIIKSCRKMNDQKSSIRLNLAAHLIPYLWFVFTVYQFTVNGC